MSITKKHIADTLASKININQAAALSITNDFFEKIKQTLASGEQVKISGFGNFNLKEKSARPGRNPKTGEAVTISARKVVNFKPGPKLKALTQKS